MKRLARFGVPPDRLQILFENYSGDMLIDFMPDYIRINEQHEIQRDLRLADLIATAINVGRTKSGNKSYQRWRRQKIKEYEDIKDELDYDKKTVFERLAMNLASKETNTIFDKLKRFSNGV